MSSVHLYTDSAEAAPRRASSVQALVERHLVDCVSMGDEVSVLLDLSAETVVREAVAVIGDRLLAALASTDFEDEIRRGPDMASRKLRRLATLRVRINASALPDDRRARAAGILRRLTDAIHADADFGSSQGDGGGAPAPSPRLASGYG